MKLAVVGATGLVGSEILEVLEEHNFAFDELLLVASERSAGKKIAFKGKDYTVIGLKQAVAEKPDIAIFPPEVLRPLNGRLNLPKPVRS